MNWLVAILPMTILAALLTAGEAVHRRARTDWWRNLQAWALYFLAGFSLLPLFAAFKVPSLIDTGELPFWLGLILFTVVRDGAEYLFHRAQHAIPLLWSMHSLHHSDPEMSALTTQRHYWGDQLVKAATIWPASLLIVSPTAEVFGAYGVLSLWHIVIHARIPFGLGRLSWLFNSPAYHRRHHSRLPEHYNSNFAGLLPVFDVICGSYRKPEGFPATGLDVQPESLLDLIAWPLRQGSSEAQGAEATAR